MTYDSDVFNSNAAALNSLAPDVSKAFGKLHQVAFSDGELSAALKELMALSISVVTGCDDCCGHHLERALSGGASREQVGEALSVAVLMGGGPAYTYAGKVAAELSAK